MSEREDAAFQQVYIRSRHETDDIYIQNTFSIKAAVSATPLAQPVCGRLLDRD